MQLSAADMVYALSAILEEPVHIDSKGKPLDEVDEKMWETNFWRGYDALVKEDVDLLEKGLHGAISLQKAIVRQGVAMINKKNIVSSGPFRYAVIDDSPDLPLFTHPLALSKLAMFVSEALLHNSAKKHKPFVICSLIERRKTYLVLGIVGTVRASAPKNSFGRAFRTAADRTKSRIKHDGFETSVMEVQKDDLSKFMEYLHSGMVRI